MSVATKRAEEMLLGFERRVKNKGGGGSYYSGGGKKKYSKPKADSGIKNFTAAANKKPEVMVKITSGSKGAKSLQNHLDYIGRNGKLSLETNDGEILTGKSQAKTIKERWLNQDMINGTGTARQTLNLVLSLPAKTPPDIIHAAARAFAQHVFSDHEYVMALHTDTKHPHVHLCVTMQNREGQRINPRKNDLHEWRVLFAEKVREQGIDCAATKRIHRGRTKKGLNSTVENISKRGGHSYVTAARRKSLVEAIQQNNRPIHPFLKEAIETNTILVSELSSLSRSLYQEGMKTEARAVSKLAKELAENKHTTRAQSAFDAASERTNERNGENLGMER